MLEKLKEYYELEYRQTERALQASWVTSKKDCVWYAIQRCLGVAQFAQIADEGLKFEDVENLYNIYKEKLENLLTNPT